MSPILDVRPERDFLACHRAGSVNIPLEELADRTYELPPHDVPLVVFDVDDRRARWARSRLGVRERAVARVESGEEWLRRGPIGRGASRARLWRPHPFLAAAVERARKRWPTLEGRSALDIACGCGREAVFLALNGFQTEAVDVLPDALARCDDLARRHGVAVTTRLNDVEAAPAIAAGGYDFVCCFNYLHRPLMPVIAQAVRPGGLVVYETFLREHRERFGRPMRDSHVLEPGELPKWFEGWEKVVFREGMFEPERIVASLVARRR
jgi:2-polyprenyl-3-methyl-5-hydroxy-6-metoxy-1,4-benzoquinol methylase